MQMIKYKIHFFTFSTLISAFSIYIQLRVFHLYNFKTIVCQVRNYELAIFITAVGLVLKDRVNFSISQRYEFIIL